MSTHVDRPYREAGVFLPHYRDTTKAVTDEQSVRPYVLSSQPTQMLLPIRRPFADPGVKTTTRYNNGGSLEELIQKYRRLGQHVPETFIWHVTVELGKALMYLWQGPRNDVVPWVSIRHRALTAENVFVNYESTKSGARFANGTPRNAFPQIVLGNFSRAARRDDPAADLLPSAMMEAYMNYSDVAAPPPPIQAAAGPAAANIAAGANAIVIRFWEDI
ncbi:hypothetical protein PG988_004699 [Apiospora saccharicola]